MPPKPNRDVLGEQPGLQPLGFAGHSQEQPAIVAGRLMAPPQSWFSADPVDNCRPFPTLGHKAVFWTVCFFRGEDLQPVSAYSRHAIAQSPPAQIVQHALLVTS